MIGDTWTGRDLPVLIAIAVLAEQEVGHGPRSHEVARHLDRDHDQVMQAMIALAPTYIEKKDDERAIGLAGVTATRITDEGRRAVGMWPSRSEHLDAFLAALDAAADSEGADEETRTRLQRVRAAAAGSGRRVLEGALAAFLAAQAPQ